MDAEADLEQFESAMTPEILREYRKTKKESQRNFWSRFGVTQSRGSRIEMGAGIPAPLAILLRLYLEGVISDGDLWQAKLTCLETELDMQEESCEGNRN